MKMDILDLVTSQVMQALTQVNKTEFFGLDLDDDIINNLMVSKQMVEDLDEYDKQLTDETRNEKSDFAHGIQIGCKLAYLYAINLFS